MSHPEILVVCLCAQWCGVCREYAAVFTQVGERMMPARFVWVDVEDDFDVVDPIDVENFPTLLVAVGAEPHFFGSLTPQPALLERIVRERMVEADPALAARTDVRALVARLRAAAV